MAAGGERELADLAAWLGQSPTDLLCALLRQATESRAPRAPQGRARPAVGTHAAVRATSSQGPQHRRPPLRADPMQESLRATD